MEITAGQRVGGRFVVGERVEGYGLGETFHARDEEARDACLVKRLPAATDARELDPKRMRQGASLVRVRAAGSADGVGWVAMDVPEGECLARRLEKQRREGGGGELAALRTLGLALCGALASAHRSGASGQGAHGGITPVSVFLRGWSRRECDVLLADFGLVPWMVTPTWSPPRVMQSVWHPVAPEFASSPRAATPATDVFAVAMIVMEFVAEAPVREAAWGALGAGKGSVASVLERARPGLHASVRDALLAALDASPARRPKDADRFAKLLRDATWSETEVVAAPKERRASTPLPPPPAEVAAPRARVLEVRSVPVDAPPSRPSVPEVAAPVRAPAPAETLVDEGPPRHLADAEEFSPSDTLPLDDPPEDPGAATVPLAFTVPTPEAVGAATLAYEDEAQDRTAPLPRARARDAGAATLDLEDAGSFGATPGANERGPHTIAPQGRSRRPPAVAPVVPAKPLAPVYSTAWDPPDAPEPTTAVTPRSRPAPAVSPADATAPLPTLAATAAPPPWKWAAVVAAALVVLALGVALLR